VVPVLPEAGVPFDVERHQLLEGAKPAPGALVGDILAPGYTFQGQVIRLPVVALREVKEEKPPKVEDAQLSFDEAGS
jgi:molecular chaperone GrpE (heat shock protein)